MTAPPSSFQHGRSIGATYTDGRLDAPAFHRNHQPILAILERLLPAGAGEVLELGSGTGQHAVAFAHALPRLTWWPTDPDPRHVASIDSWCRHSGQGNLRPACRLDAALDDWGLGRPGRPPADGLIAMVCINVLHIAPWAVALGLLRGAARHLRADGFLLIYGPFRRDGRHTAPSNAEFDKSLRARNPAWGVRDIADIATAAGTQGFALTETLAMPANNLVLVLRPTPSL